jgi:hypothetical protein
MSTPRWCLSLVGLVAAFVLTGCSCGPDTHAVNAFPNGPDVLTVVRDGVTRHVDAAGQVNEFVGAPENFQFVYNTIEGSTRGDGIRIAVGGDDPVTKEIVTLVFALPVSLRQGDVYTVGQTFAVEPSVDFPDPLAVWGPHDLQQSSRAEVGFTAATYTFPPAHFTIGYRATSATGTIQVTKREHGRAELNLNLSFVDAAGKAALVTGRMTVATQQTPAPCN